jgi:predicted nucleic acid-binding protein
MQRSSSPTFERVAGRQIAEISMDAFDADVIIYAATPGHALGQRVQLLFEAAADDASQHAGIGSVLLIPEVLSKPIREEKQEVVTRLTALLSRLDLVAVDEVTAELAAAMAATYRLRAPDAVHLATAVGSAADRFITNNRNDFAKSISEIDVIYPDELPVAAI